MLTRLRFQNFKGWKDTGEIRLAPITVFFGTNSSGKSSLLQFLLMLKQTAESPDRRRVLHPGDRMTPVDLGTFRDFVFEHEVANGIEFSLQWALPKRLEVRDPVSGASASGEQIEFQAEIGSDSEGVRQHVKSLSYHLSNGDHRLHVTMQSNEHAKFDLKADPISLVRKQGRAWKLPPPVKFYGFPDEVAAYYQNASFTSDLTLELERALRRVQYLGPLREYPARSYIWSGEIPEHVGWRGERVVDAMLAAKDRSISPGKWKRARPFHKLIAQRLLEMGLLHSFEVRPIAPHRKEYEVVVRVSANSKPVALPDVGFGVSQVLPVLVQCSYAQEHTTILLEQPEIHLHPKVQTDLADVFVEAVRSREHEHDRGIQVIVESHSEHLLRRLQRRVAEGQIEPDEIALYFCSVDSGHSVLRPLEVNPLGDIVNWPDNFFGDEMADLAARLDAAADRVPVP